MGINAIVIVRNSNQITLQEFTDCLEADDWGQRTIHKWYGKEKSWEAFEWKGKAYFSWMSTPRIRHLDLYDEDESNKGKPDQNNSVQITFLKAMYAVEQIAGGPVFVDNDVVNHHTPDDGKGDNEDDALSFWLPPDLDGFIPYWRNAKNITVDDPHMIY